MVGWTQTVGAVLDAPGAVVMLGSSDTGKTVAAAELTGEALRAGLPAAVVDADIGQSDIGPPATVGLGVPEYPVRRMSEIPPSALVFAGDSSPAGVYGYVVEGTVRLVTRARRDGARLIVVDTTGWVAGAAAVNAKVGKIARINPRHLIAIQRDAEVEPILARLPSTISIHRLRPSPCVRTRSREERRMARQRSFAAYFDRARSVSVNVRTIPCDRPARYAGRPVPQEGMLAAIPIALLRHLLVGLADGHGDLRAMGTVVGAMPAEDRVEIMAPLPEDGRFQMLQWGVLRVAPSGLEEGRLGESA
jgi:polynucleotide 5'-hydroxyl-kinase GRC3/NOL9